MRKSKKSSNSKAPKAKSQEMMEFLSSIPEQVADPILVTTRDYKIIFANKAVEKLYGYKRNELIGKKVGILSAAPVSKKFLKQVDTFGFHGKSWLSTNLNKRKDGSTFTCEFQVSPLKSKDGEINFLVTVLRDISPRKKTEDDLFQAIAHKRALIDNIPHMAWVKDREGRFLAVNKAFAKSCGYAIKEILGKTDLDVWPKMLADKYRADDFEVMRTRKKKYVEEPISETTGTKWFETFKSPVLDNKGRVIGTTGLARDITERKSAEESLRASEGKFRALTENISDITLVIDSEGMIKYVSPTIHKLYGYKLNEALNKNISDFVHPDEISKTMKKIKQVCRKPNVTFVGECVRAKGKTGGWRYWEPLLTSMFGVAGVDGIVVNCRDVTERKLARDAIQESEEQKRLVIKNMISGFALQEMIFDKKGNPVNCKYIEVNPAYMSLLGIEDPAGKTVLDIFPDFEKSWIRMFGEVVKTGIAREIERYVPPTGRWWHLVIWKVKGDQFASVCNDITARKREEKSLKRARDGLIKVVGAQTKELKEIHQALADASRLSDIGLLAASVAHELRNPLGVMRTALYNIRNKRKDTSLDSHIANIDKKILESEQIIRNLLNYARIKMPNFKTVNVISLIDDCVMHCRQKFPKIDAKIRKPSTRRKVLIQADNIQMIELLSNIINNAYQSFLKKKGNIDISLNVNKKDGMVNILIQDNGCGISKEKLKRVFDPFYTDRSKGTGLGLAVCNQIVDLHNGSINIVSSKGKGTTVSINLPIKQ